MDKQRLHTPEGVRDIYGDECIKKFKLQNKLMDELYLYGYRPIQTPSFEFSDIFEQEGTMASAETGELYRFFDREGNTLALRPDITPPIARCMAKYFADESAPLRFCYTGSIFINHNSYTGRLKECTQSGAELFADVSADADAEIVAMAVRLLLCAGLGNFQISVGHVGYLAGLFEAASMDADRAKKIKKFLLNRNFYGVEEVIRDLSLPKDLYALFELLRDLMMTREKLAVALETAEKYPALHRVIERLIHLEDLLRIYGVEKYVSYEPAMISGFDYYTGVIFAAYTFGSGEALIKGGRYDKLLASFGKDAPAIGFAVNVDLLMSALRHQDIESDSTRSAKCFVYSESGRERAILDAENLRTRGESVELMPADESTADELAAAESYKRMTDKRNYSEVVYYK